MHRCSRCGETLPASDFYTSKGKRKPWCKQCFCYYIAFQRATDERWAANHRLYAQRSQRRRRERERERLVTGRMSMAQKRERRDRVVFVSEPARRDRYDSYWCSHCNAAKPRRSFPLGANRTLKPDCCYECRTEKTCSRCGELKPLGDFPTQPAKRDGRASHCHECNVDANHVRRTVERAGDRISKRTVFERDDGRCCICGRKVDPQRYDLEHRWPLALGGTHTWDNVGVAHPSCNAAKGARVSPTQLVLQAAP